MSLQGFVRPSAGMAVEAKAPASHSNHFLVLDAARGVAAIAVVLHHIGVEDRSFILGRGFFAVDFFLILSGFVIALAYEARMQSDLTFKTFMAIRCARLWPMIVMGGVLSTIVAFVAGNAETAYSAIALQFLLLPVITGGLLFPFNPPLWSLFYELLANVGHALLLARLSLRTLCLILGALAIVDLGILWFHHFWAAGFQIEQMPYAVFRIATGYVMGVVLFRLYQKDLLPKIKAPFFLPLVLIVIPFLIPKPISERVIALGTMAFLFPLAMVLGIHNPSPDRWRRVMKWLGGISFPLYLIHMPIIHFWQATGLFELDGRYGWAAWVGMAGSAVLAATAVERWYDLPVRKRLRRHI